MKILVLGGHFTPAKALIDELKKENCRIFYIGTKKGRLFDKNNSYEYEQLKNDKNITCYSLIFGKLSRDLWPVRNFLKSILYFLRIPVGFLHAFILLVLIRPEKIYAFGSFITSIVLPVASIFKLLGTRIYLHEQTIHFSLSSRIGDKFSNKTFLSFPRRLYKNIDLRNNKYYFTGNLLRKEIFNIKTVDLSQYFGFKNSQPVIFLTGGKQGSEPICRALAKIVRTSSFNFVVQAGENGFGVFQGMNSDNLRVFKYLNSEEMFLCFKNAQLIIARSGANTIHELIFLNKNALFIPLPHSRGDEQVKNAQFASRIIPAQVLLQKDIGHLTDKFLSKIIKTPAIYRNGNVLSRKYKKAMENILRLTG